MAAHSDIDDIDDVFKRWPTRAGGYS